MADVWLLVESDDPVEGLEELSDWLGREPELKGLVGGNFSPGTGELGTMANALVVAVGSGGVLSVLAASLKAFLALPRRSDVRIKISNGPDGRTVEIDAKRVTDVETLVREAFRQGE